MKEPELLVYDNNIWMCALRACLPCCIGLSSSNDQFAALIKELHPMTYSWSRHLPVCNLGPLLKIKSEKLVVVTH